MHSTAQHSTAPPPEQQNSLRSVILRARGPVTGTRTPAARAVPVRLDLTLQTPLLEGLPGPDDRPNAPAKRPPASLLLRGDLLTLEPIGKFRL
ncbi:hypothetical protein Trco_000347 [Trichoderma cornu-damae]|uniref:Uncharacterized protein n=1 Tax=Trichoderma cornu-damae TaxID=654480 RepID=A0A9P8TZR0_9HYPO|nr:hypothetical protein Trco_000347 [Trichoderma cornu-damae]